MVGSVFLRFSLGLVAAGMGALMSVRFALLIILQPVTARKGISL